ncbi:unnamed protein product [[Actinomadura] parvosata subsp. kistnae]|uniref:Bacteriocin n=1 Tax=[Actinomadura] parvosata subsp. kistnae TaxID=1909395 RepID=A0A1V0A9M8_9ACTN|nr:hypothetical protein [Nonomuraea sp. ATCC 55076]AQZ66901.1 hypothetical protein BKM31_40500 [Nonomuraea sp. ATCC 55076]SPL94948.1 unnamed protein product [Actinomadura parvosata subsp. kistnae]
MRKVLAATALAGSMAVAALAVSPAAQAATTATVSASSSGWGKYYSSNNKAYTYGKTYKSGGKVYTHWYGKESSPKHGYVWFKYYSGGKWHQFYRHWNGSYDATWSGRGIKKIDTWTCWGGKHKYCGSHHRIYG